MKKLIKTLTVAIMALVATFACAFAVSGCKKDATADYTVTIVYAGTNAPVNGLTDGTGVEGTKVSVGICDESETHCVMLILKDICPDANGKVTFSQSFVDEEFGAPTTEFYFHVYNVSGYADPAYKISSKGTYTVTISPAQ